MYQPEMSALIPPLPMVWPSQHHPMRPSRRRNAVLKKVMVFAEMMEAAATYIQAERPKVRLAADAANLLRPVFKDKQQEELWLLLLDTRNHLISMHPCTIGLADRSQAHAREVFRTAIRENCCRMVLVHNHPSGDPMPSPQDVECTRGLVNAGRIIGIEIMDHVILGARTPSRDRDYISLRELNLM